MQNQIIFLLSLFILFGFTEIGFTKHLEPTTSIYNQFAILADTSQPEIKEVFKIVEEMPRFPGCENKGLTQNELKQCSMEKLLQFISNEVKYPEKARKNAIEGTAVVSFIVEKDGSVSQVKIVRDLEEGCGAEAARVVELMNERGIRWIPGKKRGQKVRVQFNLPVQFKLKEEKKEE